MHSMQQIHLPHDTLLLCLMFSEVGNTEHSSKENNVRAKIVRSLSVLSALSSTLVRSFYTQNSLEEGTYSFPLILITQPFHS